VPCFLSFVCKQGLKALLKNLKTVKSRTIITPLALAWLAALNGFAIDYQPPHALAQRHFAFFWDVGLEIGCVAFGMLCQNGGS